MKIMIGNLLENFLGDPFEANHETLRMLSIGGAGSEFKPPKPIPLTEEWLIKFGFELDESKIDPPETPNGNFWADYNLNGVEISMPFYEFSYNEGENVIEVKYVHKLQNLYFSLTEEELTIKQK